MADNSSTYEEFKNYLNLVEASKQALQKGRNLQPEEALPLILTVIPDDEKEYVANGIVADYENGADISRILQEPFRYLIQNSTEKAVDLSKNKLEDIVTTAPSDKLENLLDNMVPQKTSIKKYEDVIELHRKTNELRYYLKGYQEAKNETEKKSNLNQLKILAIDIIKKEYSSDDEKDVREILNSIAEHSEHYALYKASRTVEKYRNEYRDDIAGEEGKYIESTTSSDDEKFGYASFLARDEERRAA